MSTPQEKSNGKSFGNESDTSPNDATVLDTNENSNINETDQTFVIGENNLADSQTVVMAENNINGQESDASDQTVVMGKSEIASSANPDRQFGRYKLIQTIGQGGMGTVYEAYDPQVDRSVALKVISSSNVSSKDLSRFWQEIKAMGRLQHPGIIGVYDFGDSPQHYFTMELIQGETLSRVIREKPMSMKDIAKTLVDICAAIEYVHEEKILHRDLKPSNIIVTDKDVIKVMDFGLAKFTESESGLSRTGDVLGTPVYMPPEQANGQNVDLRSDLYSIGAIGYEMLTGKPPFHGTSVLQILKQVTFNEPAEPKSLNTDIAEDLQTIILKSMEKDPERRYQKVSELREDLQRFLDNRPILAKAPSLFTKSAKWVQRNHSLAISLFAIFTLATVSLVSITHLYLKTSQLLAKEQSRNLSQTLANEASSWLENRRNISFDQILKKFQHAVSESPNYFFVYQKLGTTLFDYANNPSNPIYHVPDPKGEIATQLKSGNFDAIQSFFNKNLLYPDQPFPDFHRTFALSERRWKIPTLSSEYHGISYECEIHPAKIKVFIRGSRKYFYRKAIIDLQKAWKLNPQDYVSIYQLYIVASSRIMGKETEELASSCIYGLLKIQPPPENEYGYFSRGKTKWIEITEVENREERNKGIAEVLKYYEKAFEYHTGFLCLRRYCGVAYMTQNNYPKAEENFREAIRLEEHLPDAYFDLASLYAWQRNKESAIDMLKTAIDKGFQDRMSLQQDDGVWQIIRKFQGDQTRYDEKSVWDFVREEEEFQKLFEQLPLVTEQKRK